MNFYLLDTAQAQQPSTWPPLIMMGAIFVVFYFFMIRPQTKRKQEEEKMRNSLEIGDEITTIGGIMGRVVSIKEDETDSVVIESSADRSKIRIKRWAIASIENEKTKAAAKAKEEKKGFFSRKKKENEE